MGDAVARLGVGDQRVGAGDRASEGVAVGDAGAAEDALRCERRSPARGVAEVDGQVVATQQLPDLLVVDGVHPPIVARRAAHVGSLVRRGVAPVALGELRALGAEGGEVGIEHGLQQIGPLDAGRADDLAELESAQAGCDDIGW